jgi:SAM-dependent methyltransferase
VRQDERLVFDRSLRDARLAAYAPGQFVGQESFMQASEILALATQAGVGPGVSVLDLCCGVAGPGYLVASELGCDYLGVDASASAVELARERFAGLPGRVEVARVPPVPTGPFDVVLLLETLLAFEDKEPLLRGIASALAPGGRLALTVEEGNPLTEPERAAMPDADTVWLVTLPDLLSCLARVGLEVRWQEECSASHRRTVHRLVDAFTAEERAIGARLPDRGLDDLLAAHRLWGDWLGSGRVRKFALVAEKSPIAPAGEPHVARSRS